MIAQKIAYNVLFVGAAKVISIGIALFAIGLLSRYLGPSGFGKYILVLSYLSFLMALADMGLHAITTREISRENASENDIINKVFTLRLTITFVLLLLAVSVVGFLPHDEEVRSALFVIIAAFFFSSNYSLLNAVFQKHLAMDRVAIAELCGKGIQMGTILALIYLKLPFVISIVAILLAMIMNFTLVIFFVRKYITFNLDWDTAYWKEFLKKSYPLGISAVATFLYFKVNAFILSGYHPIEDVGIYGAATKIIETIVFFPAMVIGLVLPLLSRYIFDEKKAFAKTTEATIKFFTVVLIPLVISIIFLAPEAIALINGPDFAAAVPVLQVSALSLVGIFFGHLFMNIAISGNLQNLLTKILVATAVFNIGINFLLIPQYSYMGAAISAVITEVFVMGVVWYMIAKKTTFRFVLQKPAVYIIAGLLLIACNYLLSFNVFIGAVVGFGAYTAVLFIMGVVTSDDLQKIRPSIKDDGRSV